MSSDDRHDPTVTRREHPAPGATVTRREPPPSGATTTRREPAPAGNGDEASTRVEGDGPASPYVPFELPEGLAERFEVLRELGSGSEARVGVIRDRTSGDDLVVKVYHWDHVGEQEALRELQQAGEPPTSHHVVRLYEFGHDDGRWYEIQEYCPDGTLHDLLRLDRSLRPDAPAVGARALAEQLAPTLEHLEGRVFHRDLKPANILVRSSPPPDSTGAYDFAIADFGLARPARHDKLWIKGGTPAYQPPEGAFNRVTVAWDWWSLGIVLAEVALGRHPLSQVGRRGEPVFPEEATIPEQLQRRPIDVSGIDDEEVRTLCRGLLHRDPERRWRAEQVRAWRQGRAPEVPADGADPFVRRTRPVQNVEIEFVGEPYPDPAALAAAFQGHWQQSRDWVFGASGHVQWRRRLVAFLAAHGRHDAAGIVERGPEAAGSVHAAMAFLLVAMDPDLHPIFDGIRLTRQGLNEVGLRAADGEGTERLAELRAAGALTIWQALEVLPDAAAADRRWQDGCRRIDDLVHEIGPEGRELGTAAERAKAGLLLCAIDDQRHPRYAGDLRAQLELARSSPASQTGWWARLADLGAGGDGALPAVALAVASAPYARVAEGRDHGDLDPDVVQAELDAGDGIAGGRGLYDRFLTTVSSRVRTVLWAGVLVGHIGLIATYGDRIAGTAADNDTVRSVRSLQETVPWFVGVLVGFVVVQQLGVQLRRRPPRPVVVRLYAGVASLVQAATLGAIVLSGLIDVHVGDAAATDPFFPTWCRGLESVYLVVVLFSLVLLVRTAGRFLRAVRGRYAMLMI